GTGRQIHRVSEESIGFDLPTSTIPAYLANSRSKQAEFRNALAMWFATGARTPEAARAFSIFELY
ncbi:MAG TPA: hypothetical protein VIV60_32425, partial [Polyangiaceae bacterium]